MFDHAAFGRDLAIEIKRIITPLESRLERLEAQGEMKYSGIWEEGREYLRGNFITHSGSLWHAEMPTRSRPGTDATWRLAVKNGQFK